MDNLHHIMHEFFNNVIDSSIIGQIYANFYLIMIIFTHAYELYEFAVGNFFLRYQKMDAGNDIFGSIVQSVSYAPHTHPRSIWIP